MNCQLMLPIGWKICEWKMMISCNRYHLPNKWTIQNHWDTCKVFMPEACGSQGFIRAIVQKFCQFNIFFLHSNVSAHLMRVTYNVNHSSTESKWDRSTKIKYDTGPQESFKCDDLYQVFQFCFVHIDKLCKSKSECKC